MIAATLLPPDRFLWAVVDGALVRGVRGAELDRRIGFLAEEVIPLPLETLQLAWVRAHAGATAPVIVCAVPSEELEHGDDGGAVHVGPAAWPAALRAHPLLAGVTIDADPTDLNLLHGRFEPPVVRRWRRGTTAAVAAGIGLVVAVSCLAMQSRIDERRGVARDAQATRLDLIDAILPPPSGGDGTVLNRQPPDLRLAVELRRLRPTRGSGDGSLASSASAAPNENRPTADLASLLRAWPDQEGVLTESIALRDGVATLRLLLPSNEALATFLESLSSGGDWTIRPPQVTATREGVQATIRAERVAGDAVARAGTSEAHRLESGGPG